MTYVLTQIVMSLTAAAFFGAALGWLFGRSMARRHEPGPAREPAPRHKEVQAQLEQANARLQRQEEALAESRAALDDKEAAFSQLRHRFDAMKTDLDEARAARAGIEFEAESLKGRIRDAEAGLAAAATSIEERERRLESIEAQVQQAEARATELAEEALRLRKRTSELTPLIELHETLRREHGLLKEAHDELKREKIRLERELTGQRRAGRPDPSPDRSARPDRVLKITPATPEAAANLSPAAAADIDDPDDPDARPFAGKPRLVRPNRPPPPEIDDLKRIRGIGEVLEGRLRELGYKTYRDIAQLTPAQVTELSIKLDGFGDRITRDGWVDQARVLARDSS